MGLSMSSASLERHGHQGAQWGPADNLAAKCCPKATFAGVGCQSARNVEAELGETVEM